MPALEGVATGWHADCDRLREGANGMTTNIRYIVRASSSKTKKFKLKAAALTHARKLIREGEGVTVHSYDVADGVETAVEF